MGPFLGPGDLPWGRESAPVCPPPFCAPFLPALGSEVRDTPALHQSPVRWSPLAPPSLLGAPLLTCFSPSSSAWKSAQLLVRTEGKEQVTWSRGAGAACVLGASVSSSSSTSWTRARPGWRGPSPRDTAQPPSGRTRLSPPPPAPAVARAAPLPGGGKV